MVEVGVIDIIALWLQFIGSLDGAPSEINVVIAVEAKVELVTNI